MKTWDEMSPRERDALVATEVMEWTVNRSERGWATVGVTPKRLIGPSKCRLPGDCWSPWKRIEHAWEVVEKVSGNGVCFSCGRYAGYAGRWGAEFFIEDTGERLGTARSKDTAPEAICLAALRAKGIDV